MDILAERISWAIDRIKNDRNIGRGISNEELAKVLGTNVKTLAVYKEGRGLIKSSVLEGLVSKFNFNSAWLIEGTGEPFPGARAKYPEVCGPEEPVRAASGAVEISISEAIANIAPLIRHLEQAVRNMEKEAAESLTIKEILNILGRHIDVEGLLDVFLEKAMRATKAKIGSIFIKDPTTGQFRIAVAKGLEGPEKDTYIDIQNSLVRSVVAEKKTLLVQNIETDPRTRKKNEQKYGPPSFLSVPLLTDDEVSGTLNLAGKEAGRLFDRQDEEIINRIIPGISAALAKSRQPGNDLK